MKKEFPGYYRPTKEEFNMIWESCDFLFDTNVLLNLYRYSIDTRKTLIEIMEQIKDRIWIPYQVGFEFHMKRLDVIENQKDAYKKIKEQLIEYRNKIENELSNLCKSGRHPYINCEDFLSELTKSFDDFFVDLDAKKEKHPDLIDNDPIKYKLTELFEGRVCDQLDPKEKDRIIKEGAERYKKEIPPGYKDSSYGDLIIWFEILNHAIKEKKPIILVTDDRKEDWWYRHSGKTIGPRPELVNEIQLKAGVRFYMYSADKFMRYAKEYLKSKVEQKAIEEAREIRLQEERTQKQIDKQEEWIRTLIGSGALSLTDQLKLSSLPGMDEMAEVTKDMLKIAEMAKIPESWKNALVISAMDKNMLKISEMAEIPESWKNALAISAVDENMLKIAEIAKIPESWRNALGISGMDVVAKEARDMIASIYPETISRTLGEVEAKSKFSEKDLRKLKDSDVINDENKLSNEKLNKDSVGA